MLSEHFGSSEYYEFVLRVRSEKIQFRRIFKSLVAFSDRMRLVATLSQGAGELGPLARKSFFYLVRWLWLQAIEVKEKA